MESQLQNPEFVINPENFHNLRIIICRIQNFEADFLWKVSLKILSSGLILKTLTHVKGRLISLHCVLSGEAKDSSFLCADREDSDQIELISVFCDTLLIFSHRGSYLLQHFNLCIILIVTTDM